MECDVGMRELCLRCDGYSALEPDGKKRVTDDHAEALRDGCMRQDERGGHADKVIAGLRYQPRLVRGFYCRARYARTIAVALPAPQKPLMEVVGGYVHERRKQAAIESGRRSAMLQALHYRYVLCKYQTPGFVKALASLLERVSERLSVSIKKAESLAGLVGRLRSEQNDKEVVGLNAQKHIGVERKVLSGFQPFAVPA